VGSEDCLSDDCKKFLFKLTSKNNDKQHRLIIYEKLTHGFMNYYIPFFGSKQANKAVDESCEFLKRLIT